MLICPKHRAEHSGKNVYSAAIDQKLYELTKDEEYFKRAKSRVERTLKKLAKDPEYGYWIFYPGRLSRWNMSGSVIDSGACSDVLSSFYLAHSDKLGEKEKEEIKDAIFKNADTYLNNAVVSKEVTNQRLWGGTGLSRAYKIFKKEEWKKNLIASIEKSFGEMLEDGTFSYHPSWKEFKIFKGINDTTTFYHSRCSAFIYYILENIGESAEKYKEKLIKAADLLVAMYQPDGVKNINLECKRWYWNSKYEIASAPFDIYTLAKTYNLTGNKIYLYYVKKALEQIFRHQLKDGGITSHLGEPQRSFQCRIFWNSNLAWLAKVLEEIKDFSEAEEVEENLRYFSDSGIVKFKNKNYACILRGKKQPMSLMWGPAIGGGSLLYFGLAHRATAEGNAKNNWKNEIEIKSWQADIPGNFSFCANESFFKNLKNFIAENRSEIRGKLFHAESELRRPNIMSFFFLIFNLFKMVFQGARGIYTTQWATNAEVNQGENTITFEAIPVKRNGKELEGVKIRREYAHGRESLTVRERLFFENCDIKKIKYGKIPQASGLKIISSAKYKETPSEIIIYPGEKFNLEISYKL